MKRYDVVLTAYLDEGGDLQFHGGSDVSEWKRDMEGCGASFRSLTLLRRFYIKGKIVKESGLIEPIRVRR